MNGFEEILSNVINRLEQTEQAQWKKINELEQQNMILQDENMHLKDFLAEATEERRAPEKRVKPLKYIRELYELYVSAKKSGFLLAAEKRKAHLDEVVKKYLKMFFLNAGMKKQPIRFSQKWDKKSEYFKSYMMGIKLKGIRELAEMAGNYKCTVEDVYNAVTMERENKGQKELNAHPCLTNRKPFRGGEQ
jgi:regulator of replication initiation timing